MRDRPQLIDHLIDLERRRAQRQTLAARSGLARRLRPALQLPALAERDPRIAPRRGAGAEPRGHHPGEGRPSAGAGLHAGAGIGASPWTAEYDCAVALFQKYGAEDAETNRDLTPPGYGVAHRWACGRR